MGQRGQGSSGQEAEESWPKQRGRGHRGMRAQGAGTGERLRLEG